MVGNRRNPREEDVCSTTESCDDENPQLYLFTNTELPVERRKQMRRRKTRVHELKWAVYSSASSRAPLEWSGRKAWLAP